jgi:hypothetical protein
MRKYTVYSITFKSASPGSIYIGWKKAVQILENGKITIDIYEGIRKLLNVQGNLRIRPELDERLKTAFLNKSCCLILAYDGDEIFQAVKKRKEAVCINFHYIFTIPLNGFHSYFLEGDFEKDCKIQSSGNCT